MFISDSHTELKSIFNESIKKEIIAFLNTKGGTLFIGISNQGKILGLENGQMQHQRGVDKPYHFKYSRLTPKSQSQM